MNKHAPTRNRRQMWWARTLLALGYTVMYADLDVVVRRDPLAAYDPQYDLQVPYRRAGAVHHLHGLCCGWRVCGDCAV